MGIPRGLWLAAYGTKFKVSFAEAIRTIDHKYTFNFHISYFQLSLNYQLSTFKEP